MKTFRQRKNGKMSRKATIAGMPNFAQLLCVLLNILFFQSYQNAGVLTRDIFIANIKMP